MNVGQFCVSEAALKSDDDAVMTRERGNADACWDES